MKIFCIALLLSGVVGHIYSADAGKVTNIVKEPGAALAGFVQVWKKPLQSKKKYYVEPLPNSPKMAAIGDDGTVAILDKKTGRCLSSFVSSAPQQKISHVKAVPGDQVVLVRQNGMMEVVKIDQEGDCSGFEMPSGSVNVRSIAFGLSQRGQTKGKERLVVVGLEDERYGRISEFNVDTWECEESLLDHWQDGVRTGPDGKIWYFDGVSGNERLVRWPDGISVNGLCDMIRVSATNSKYWQTLIKDHDIVDLAYEKGRKGHYVYAATRDLKNPHAVTEITAWCAMRDEVKEKELDA